MERFIDPKTLARVKDMPLVARSVAEGFLSGIQPSQQRGVGIEFAQYRAYEPGDEPKRIDWKLFARSDRYFVREADRESEIATWIVVDCSRSMAQRSERGAWDKFDYARHLAATLAYLAQRQGDLPGLLMLNTHEQLVVPPAAGERQWAAFRRGRRTFPRWRVHIVAGTQTAASEPRCRDQRLLRDARRDSVIHAWRDHIAQ